MKELVNNGIEIYQFPVDDETFADNNARMNVSTHTRARTHTHTHTSVVISDIRTLCLCMCFRSSFRLQWLGVEMRLLLEGRR
jgi:hypothetical protein